MHKKLAVVAVSFALSAILNPLYAEISVKAPVQAAEPNALAALARDQASRGQVREAENNYRRALSIDPLHIGALNGLIALYRQQGMAAKLQLMIAQLTPAQRSALGSSLKQIETAMLQDQADLRLAKGQDDQAIKFLEQAVQVDADDPWLHFRLARQYARRGSHAVGLTLLEDFLARHPDDADALYVLALYQSGQGDNAGALQNLSRIETAKRTPDMVALQRRLAIKNLGPQARALMQSGKRDDAIKMAAEAEAASAGNAELTLAVALAWAELNDEQRGRALLDKARGAEPDALKLNRLDREARASVIRILGASGGRTDAVRQVDAWAADNRSSDVEVARQLGGMYLDLGEYARAKQLFDALLAAHPEAAYVLYDAWKMAQRAGQPDDEIAYLTKLVVAEPAVHGGTDAQLTAPESAGLGEFGSADKIQRDWKAKKLAALIDRRSRWVAAAMDVRNREGTAGLSEYHSVEMPLEYRTPWHGGDEAFFRSDLVEVNAGRVDSARSDFGSMQFCQPTCTQASPDQASRGASFTAGYRRGDLAADIGVTPLNFPVSNLVGGIVQKGDLGQFGYALEASRRPVTASYLSYAGARDPNTGKVWGGVVATGGRLGLSLDKGETWGFWSSAGLHSLTGRDVQSNRRFQLMAGEQWRVVNEENRRLVLGLTGMYWNFSENAGEYTYGHGGYYSPHNYRSLSLPVTYMARLPRFSYLLRASASVSQTQAKQAPYYPTDSALQAAAGAAAYYTGGDSLGKGFSAMVAWEHQVQPRLFFGGLLAIDRSDYYAPNRGLVYLRYSWDHAGAQPVFLPPEPVEPSSQF